MKNLFFPEDEVTKDDLYFLCTMIERVSRNIHVRNMEIVNTMGYDELYRKISLASVLHSENPNKLVEDWIKEYGFKQGKFEILNIDEDLVEKVPTVLQMGKVYKRLIIHTLQPDEDYIQGLIRVYNAPICKVIDNYNSSAYYQPTPVLVKGYYNNEL